MFRKDIKKSLLIGLTWGSSILFIVFSYVWSLLVFDTYSLSSLLLGTKENLKYRIEWNGPKGKNI